MLSSLRDETAPLPAAEEVAPEDESFSAGHMLAQRFRLVRQLGRGGLGYVWLARDMQLDDEEVACKILRKDLFYDRRAIADMKREVLMSRKLRHRYILAVHSFWEGDGYRFITMEYIQGRSLSDALIARGAPFSLQEVMPWIGQMSEALDYAHSEQVLHRDVKPGNILLGDDGRVRLADFGIARMAKEVRARATGEMTSGTLLFMSPEQLLGERLDPRSDLYSLAATLYELLTGMPPFYEGSVITQIQMKPVAPIPFLDDALNEVILRALSKTPANRQDSCGTFYQELAQAAGPWMASHPGGVAAQPSSLKPIPGLAWNPDAATVRLHVSRTEEHRPRVGMLLVQAGIVTGEQLGEALRVQECQGGLLGDVLVSLGYVAEETVAEAVGAQLQVAFIHLDRETIDPAVAALVPGRVARARHVLPIRREGDRIVVAMVDPLDLGALNEMERLCRGRVEIRIAPESALLGAIARTYGDTTET